MAFAPWRPLMAATILISSLISPALHALPSASSGHALTLLAQASEIRAIANEGKRGEADFAHRRALSVGFMVGLTTGITPRATQY